jgi:D-serine dehydratase
VGSRCGPINRALELLELKDKDTDKASNRNLRVEKYITKTFPLAQADQAIQCAAEKSTMKVQIICSEQ